MKPKRLLGLLLAFMLGLSLLPAAALADGTQFYSYLGVDGPQEVSVDSVTKLTGGADLSLSAGCYVVDSDVTINSLAVTEGTVNLILLDGCTLTVTQDVTVGSADAGLLAVFCQNGGTGTLKVRNIAASNNSNIYFNGGVISASGSIAAPNGKVYIRWSVPANSVTAASYGADVDFDSPFVINGSNDPALTSDTSAVAGKKLVPAYQVSFDAGEGAGTMGKAYVPASSPSYPLPACTFTPPENMTFDHWEIIGDDAGTPVSGTLTLTGWNTTWIAKYQTAQPEPPEGVSWALEDGVLKVNGTGAMEDYERGGAPWFARRAEITSVIIGPDVTHIGNYAFYACGAIRSVSIQGSGVRVGSRAFSYCSGLSSVALGDSGSISSLGEGAFYACFMLSNRGFAGAAQVGNKAFELCGLGG
jgi:hypothetical protein